MKILHGAHELLRERAGVKHILATAMVGAMTAGAAFVGAAPADAASLSAPASPAGAVGHPARLAGQLRPVHHTGAKATRTKKLLVRYATTSTCNLYPNYGKKGKAWQIPAGKSIIWRYNIDHTWAMVSDPRRAAGKHFPWWGVAKRSCVGKSIKQKGYPAGRKVPRSILRARSAVNKSGWRRVIWHVPASPITRRNITLRHNATLRDPAHLVLGNLSAGIKVHLTSGSTSKGRWVKVYVPALHRYGYIEAAKLR